MQTQLLVTDIAVTLNDTSHITYKIPEIIAAINDGKRHVCQFRPDAKSVTKNKELAAGTRQTLDLGDRRLIDVVRNMGADGLIPGNAVRSTVSMNDLDNYDSDWHNSIDISVSEFIYDEARPDEFYIYPAVQIPHYLEIKVALNPVDVLVVTDDIDINDIYSPQLVSWALYRLLSRDSANSPNVQRAALFEASFYQSLGVKSQSDLQVSPNQ